MKTFLRRVAAYFDRAHRPDRQSWQAALLTPGLNPTLARDVTQAFSSR